MRPDTAAARWEAKRAWHGRQRNLSVREKLEIVIQLQRRQVAINETKVALGLPPIPMRVWETKP